MLDQTRRLIVTSLIGAATAALVPLAGPAAARTLPSPALHIAPFKIGIFTVTVGLSGQASLHASGLPCKSGYEICDETANAEYHVDMTYPNVELSLTSARPAFSLPTLANNSKHVVNGSFQESGHWIPAGSASDAPPQSFSCNGALSATAAEGGGDNLSWTQHGSSYAFSAITEQYGFDGVAQGSDPCNGSAWFGGGRLEYRNEMTAFFTLTTAQLGAANVTKTVGGPDARYREPDTCFQDADSGSCKFDEGWTAIVKLHRTRILSSPGA